MNAHREVAEASDLLAGWRGVLDPATVAWLDQRAAQVADDVPLSTLVAAWNEDHEELDDVDPDQLLLGRLVVAMALVAKDRPVRIEAS